jgi:hypothetical protein
MLVKEEFSKALEELWARDSILVDDAAALATTISSSFAAGGDSARAAADLLMRSGVRAQWNDVLRRDRAAVLAKRIRPHVIEPMLDVLAGDGSVCCALADLGVGSLAATERSGDYAEDPHLPPCVEFKPFTDDLDLGQFNASTALLSTVLHHEPDPIRLLEALAKANIGRWIVVENCVTPQFSRPFHQFADRFFNNCLNEFGVHCVEQHRTLDEWADLLKSYGTVTIVDDAFTVPGIPFPYSLLTVTRHSN